MQIIGIDLAKVVSQFEKNIMTDQCSPGSDRNGTFTQPSCSRHMKHAASAVVRFPAERTARPAPAAGGASRWEIWKGRMQEWTGRLLLRLGVPGAINNAEIKDTVTGQEVSVAVGVFYVRISINGRDYYFDRVTGRFDGTGACP